MGMERLKSRKFWVAIISALMVAVGEQFGLDLDPEQVIGLASIASLYIIGQAQVDKQQVAVEVEEQVARLKRDANAIIGALSSKLEEVAEPTEDANTELFNG